jgi:hypothetical protein
MAIVYPRTTHREAHFTGSATVRDVVIGMSDGLTVPFALAAGLSGAVNSSFVVGRRRGGNGGGLHGDGARRLAGRAK